MRGDPFSPPDILVYKSLGQSFLELDTGRYTSIETWYACLGLYGIYLTSERSLLL